MKKENAFEKIKKIINSFKKENIICIPHTDADIDGIASCYILNQILGIKIGLLNEPLSGAMNFIKLFNVNVEKKIIVSDFDLVIFVDSCDIIQFANIIPKKSIIIDHHLSIITHPIQNILYSVIKLKSEYISCTSLLLDMINEENISISGTLSSAIIAGFISDGGWLNATGKVRQEIEKIIVHSEYSLYKLSQLNKKSKITDKLLIKNSLKALSSIDYYCSNDIDIVFVKATDREEYFYLFDNILDKFDIQIFISGIEESGSNIVRIEMIRPETRKKEYLQSWFVELSNLIENNYFKIEYGRFSSTESWAIIKQQMTSSLFEKNAFNKKCFESKIEE